MLSRRDFVQMGLAAGAIWGAGAPWSRLAAQQALTQNDLLAFKPVGNVTLMHITDIHAQLMPIYFREPSVNLGVGEAKGLPPHVTGVDFLKRFGLQAGSAEAYALSDQDFTALAGAYGRVGGIATQLVGIEAQRGRALEHAGVVERILMGKQIVVELEEPALAVSGQRQQRRRATVGVVGHGIHLDAEPQLATVLVLKGVEGLLADAAKRALEIGELDDGHRGLHRSPAGILGADRYTAYRAGRRHIAAGRTHQCLVDPRGVYPGRLRGLGVLIGLLVDQLQLGQRLGALDLATVEKKGRRRADPQVGGQGLVAVDFGEDLLAQPVAVKALAVQAQAAGVALQILGAQGLGLVSGEWRGVRGKPVVQMMVAVVILVTAAGIMAYASTLT